MIFSARFLFFISAVFLEELNMVDRKNKIVSMLYILKKRELMLEERLLANNLVKVDLATSSRPYKF